LISHTEGKYEVTVFDNRARAGHLGLSDRRLEKVAYEGLHNLCPSQDNIRTEC
jgi:hypothetical protein